MARICSILSSPAKPSVNNKGIGKERNKIRVRRGKRDGEVDVKITE